jgi:hypothetical protein
MEVAKCSFVLIGGCAPRETLALIASCVGHNAGTHSS